MTLPLYQNGFFDYPTGMAIAVALGFFFGFVLERAGFSRATILAAQFYGRNNRVFKVMFTAIVTATVGLGVLGGFGLIDLQLVLVPATNYTPLAVGGFLLGVGFIMSGYCPGTAVVGTASGSKDAAISLLGMVLGSLAFALSWPYIESFYEGYDRGALRLTDLLGAPWPVVAFAVLLMALLGFWGAEALERVLAKKDKTEVPDADPRAKHRVFALLSALAAVGLLSLAIPVASAKSNAPAKTIESIDAVELAVALSKDPRAYWLVDLRSAQACAEKRLPGALCLSENKDASDAKQPRASKRTATDFIRDLPPQRTLVLYAAGTALELPEAAKAYSGRIMILKGGYEEFHRKLYVEPKPPQHASPEQFAAYLQQVELYKALSGKSATAVADRAPPKAVSRASRKGGGC